MKSNLKRNCPVCNGDNYSELFYKENHYIQCKICSMVYADSVIKSNELNKYYESAEHWVKKIGDDEELKRKRKIGLKHVKILKKYIDKNSSILDVGCGSGDFLLQLKENSFYNIFGVEPNKAMQKYIKNKLKIPVYSDYKSLKKQKFDCISIIKVIEHLENPNQTIADCSRVMRKNGILFLVFPYFGGLGKKILREKHAAFQKEHINFFTRKAIALLLEKHHFKIVYTQTEYVDVYPIFKHLFGLKEENKTDHKSNVLDCASLLNDASLSHKTNFKWKIKKFVKKPFSLLFYHGFSPLLNELARMFGFGDYLIVVARKTDLNNEDL